MPEIKRGRLRGGNNIALNGTRATGEIELRQLGGIELKRDLSLVHSKLTATEAQAVRRVLDSLPSENSRRAYGRALSDFLLWHKGVGRPPLNKAVVQRYAVELREAGMSASSVNQRMK